MQQKIIVLLIISFVGSIGTNSIFAQNFRGLQGSSLVLEEDLSPLGMAQDAEEELLRQKLAEKGIKNGKLLGVQVLEDAQNRLALEVDYKDFTAEPLVYSEILNSSKKRLTEIPPTLTTLQAAQKSLELNFTLDERRAGDSELEAAYLKIIIIYPLSDKIPLREILNEMIEARVANLAGSFDALGFTTLYRLPKKWRSSAASSKPIKLTVSLRAIGRAGSIPQNMWPRFNPPNRVSPKNEDTQSKGPSAKTVSLWENLATDVNLNSPEEVSAISMVLYQDQNPASGVYYYLPNAYHLRWDSNEGPYLRMSYEGLANNQKGSGQVKIAASLSPSISNKEVETIKWLLYAHTAQSGLLDPVLSPMPLQETPLISLGLGSLYQIPANSISVIAGSTIFDPLEVTWNSDSKTKDDIEVHLIENLGIRGSIRFKPGGESLPVIQLPVRITLSDARTFGKFDLDARDWRTIPWQNSTPYPLKLLRMHRLVLKPAGNKLIPTIYSWSLGDIEVPAGAKVTFRASQIPRWLDGPSLPKDCGWNIGCYPAANVMKQSLMRSTALPPMPARCRFILKPLMF